MPSKLLATSTEQRNRTDGLSNRSSAWMSSSEFTAAKHAGQNARTKVSLDPNDP